MAYFLKANSVVARFLWAILSSESKCVTLPSSSLQSECDAPIFEYMSEADNELPYVGNVELHSLPGNHSVIKDTVQGKI